jgi:hypothetical protein
MGAEIKSAPDNVHSVSGYTAGFACTIVIQVGISSDMKYHSGESKQLYLLGYKTSSSVKFNPRFGGPYQLTSQAGNQNEASNMKRKPGGARLI